MKDIRMCGVTGGTCNYTDPAHPDRTYDHVCDTWVTAGQGHPGQRHHCGNCGSSFG